MASDTADDTTYWQALRMLYPELEGPLEGLGAGLAPPGTECGGGARGVEVGKEDVGHVHHGRSDSEDEWEHV